MSNQQHVITIKALPGESGGAVMFPLTGHVTAAKSIWVFMVENIRPGFTVELSSYGGAAELTRASGSKITPELYRAIMGDDMN